MNGTRLLTAILAAGLASLLAVSTASAAPASDTFAHATPINSLPFNGATNDTSATVQASEPTPSCYTGNDYSASVWWHYTPATAVKLVASLDGYQALAIYRGTSLTGLAELTCGWGSDNLNVSIAAGQSIYFQVGTQPGGGGPITLSVQRQ